MKSTCFCSENFKTKSFNLDNSGPPPRIAYLSIILYILKKNHCYTSMMYDYIIDRDRILNELMELYDIPRWESKKLILKSINSPYIINKVNKKLKIKSILKRCCCSRLSLLKRMMKN